MRDNIMMTFANQKGGVGKTTLCTMFADYLAAKGESVLVVDFDRQQTISIPNGRKTLGNMKVCDCLIPCRHSTSKTPTT